MAGPCSGHIQRHDDMTANAAVHRRRRADSQRAQARKDEEAEWVQWLVPVFGVAAAATFALYTRYLKDARRKATTSKYKDHKTLRPNMKLVDLSLTAKNGRLIKSRSALV